MFYKIDVMENEEKDWNLGLLALYADMHIHLCNYWISTKKIISNQDFNDEQKVMECNKALLTFQERQREHVSKFHPNLIN